MSGNTEIALLVKKMLVIVAILIRSILPSYHGPEYKGDVLRGVHAECSEALPASPSYNSARADLEKGAYKKDLLRVEEKHHCLIDNKFWRCTVQQKRQVNQPAKYSRHYCKGCPFCFPNSPCFVWPCDSVTQARPHAHIGDAEFFPERDGCPFLAEREDPVLVEPEQSQIITHNTCEPYEKNSKYHLVLTRKEKDQETRLYKEQIRNTCESYENKCQRVQHICAHYADGQCARWQSQYVCKVVREQIDPQPSFALQDVEPPQEELPQDGSFAKAVGLLGAVMQDVRKASSSRSLRVFTGGEGRCRNDIANFRNCCETMQGWGKSLGFWCKDHEKELAYMRAQKRCVLVGVVPIRTMGAVTGKEQVYCCYESAFVRLLQEFAHYKLNKGWGVADLPNCSGLTIEELEGMSFDDLPPEKVAETLKINGRPINYDVLKKKIYDIARAAHAAS